MSKGGEVLQHFLVFTVFGRSQPARVTTYFYDINYQWETKGESFHKLAHRVLKELRSIFINFVSSSLEIRRLGNHR